MRNAAATLVPMLLLLLSAPASAHNDAYELFKQDLENGSLDDARAKQVLASAQSTVMHAFRIFRTFLVCLLSEKPRSGPG